MIICILLAFTIVVLLDCTSLLHGQYGRMNPNDGITRLFESYQIQQDYNYYYSGPDSHPNAILGLDKKYPLATTLWKPFEASSEKLKPLVAGMKEEVYQTNRFLHGFVILDTRGNTIGIWYSVLDARQPVIIHDNGTVDVYTPDLNQEPSGRSEVPSGSHK
jgi:hypothetical protein